MAHGRIVFGVALLVAFAGTATAQPYPGAGFGSVPPGLPPGAIPAGLPAGPMFLPPNGPPGAMPPGIPMPMPGQSTPFTAAPYPGAPLPADDHPAGMRELPGLPDLIPAPAHGGHGGHGNHGCATCGDHHEISGFMTPFYPEHRGFYSTGEFLLMRPRYSDFDYVIRGTDPGLATVGPIDSIKYGTGTGLRVELGYHFGEGGKWDVAGAYTYFSAGQSNDSSAFAAPGTVLFPTLTRPGLTDRALTAVTTADLDYQLYDILAARRLLLDEHFAVRLMGGVRFADLRQTASAFYDGLDARQAAVNTRSRFQGVGPFIGGEAVLVGWKGFHLYSRAIGGLITGRNTNQVIETNDAGATTYINTSYDVRKVVPMASVLVGLGWQYRTISLRAGYEIAHWQGVFERPRFVDDVSQGKVITRPANLTLEGVVFQLGLSF